MIELTDNYRKASKDFQKMFGTGIPLFLIPANETTDGIIEKINQCLTSGKNTLLAMYGINTDDKNKLI